MRIRRACGVVALLLSATLAGSAQELPELPPPTKEHQWLEQLVGEWETEGEAIFDPSQPPIKSKGSESVRAVGGFWVLAENRGEIQDIKFTGFMTLGYDAQKKLYVGTWVDSMTSYLWTYEGTLDDAGKVLTLNTKGPSPYKPGELCRFRDMIEIKSKDHKVLSSSFEGEDGNWVPMMTMHFRRKP
jgi:hypothetical protein